ncbi:MAG: restriction endonuclease, partial [Oceanospirillaceae bacterium]|nr:restriction endonuclease [Oceanospirillaceae bacterium]
NLNPEQVAKNRKYVMRITGDDKEGKDELDHFIDPEEPYPVIAVTSELMTTGVDAKTCKLVVLDQRIQSMTEFKQIIGRGTRIDEHFGKHWFTILDFKKATELFADEKFDGPPEQIYEPEAGGSIVPPEPGDENTAGGVEYPGATYDPNMGCSGDPSTDPSTDGYNTGAEPWGPGDEPREPRKKFHVGSVEFSIIDQRVQYLGSDGKLISESLTDFTRKSVQGQYATLNDFIKRWNDADRKQAVIDELSAQGVSWEDLTEDLKGKLGDEPDPFDVILHIVYGQPALTRKQRVVHAKSRRNIFDRYNTQAQAVLDALLDKYADTGVQSIEDIKVLKLAPFDQMGTPMELLSAFGGKDDYTSAIRELETSLYEDDAG